MIMTLIIILKRMKTIKKNWTRFDWIDTNFWGDEFESLENEFIRREKEENQKKFKKSKEIIKKKKIN